MGPRSQPRHPRGLPPSLPPRLPPRLLPRLPPRSPPRCLPRLLPRLPPGCLPRLLPRLLLRLPPRLLPRLQLLLPPVFLATPNAPKPTASTRRSMAASEPASPVTLPRTNAGTASMSLVTTVVLPARTSTVNAYATLLWLAPCATTMSLATKRPSSTVKKPTFRKNTWRFLSVDSYLAATCHY